MLSNKQLSQVLQQNMKDPVAFTDALKTIGSLKTDVLEKEWANLLPDNSTWKFEQGMQHLAVALQLLGEEIGLKEWREPTEAMACN